MHLERRAIRSIADDVDRLHQDAMETIGDGPTPPSSRRSFLKKVGVGGAVLTAGGAGLPQMLLPAAFAQDDDSVGTDPQDDASQDDATQDDSGQEDEGDVPVEGGGDGREGALFAKTLELAVVELYGLAADRFEALGDDELRSVAENFGEHHLDHADAIGTNVLVQSDQQIAETEADPALLEELRPELESAADVPAVASVLLDLEERLCATYLELIGVLVEASDAKAMALMLPVDAQHAVVWSVAADLQPGEYLLASQTESEATPFAATTP